jgi:hypothetical protein
MLFVNDSIQAYDSIISRAQIKIVKEKAYKREII